MRACLALMQDGRAVGIIWGQNHAATRSHLLGFARDDIVVGKILEPRGRPETKTEALLPGRKARARKGPESVFPA